MDTPGAEDVEGEPVTVRLRLSREHYEKACTRARLGDYDSVEEYMAHMVPILVLDVDLDDDLPW